MFDIRVQVLGFITDYVAQELKQTQTWIYMLIDVCLHTNLTLGMINSKF